MDSWSDSIIKMDDTLLTLAQVQERIPKSRTTLYRWSKEGIFPKPVPVGPSGIAWVESEIDQYIEEQKEKRTKVH